MSWTLLPPEPAQRVRRLQRSEGRPPLALLLLAGLLAFGLWAAVAQLEPTAKEDSARVTADAGQVRDR